MTTKQSRGLEMIQRLRVHTTSVPMSGGSQSPVNPAPWELTPLSSADMCTCLDTMIFVLFTESSRDDSEWNFHGRNLELAILLHVVCAGIPSLMNMVYHMHTGMPPTRLAD